MPSGAEGKQSHWKGSKLIVFTVDVWPPVSTEWNIFLSFSRQTNKLQKQSGPSDSLHGPKSRKPTAETIPVLLWYFSWLGVNANSYQHKGTHTELKIRLILSYFITHERKKMVVSSGLNTQAWSQLCDSYWSSPIHLPCLPPQIHPTSILNSNMIIVHRQWKTTG